MEQAATVQIGVELATVERLDAIIEDVRAAGEAGQPGALDSYSRIIDWAADHACNSGTPEQWAHAERESLHRAATLGPLVLIEVDVDVERALCGAVAAAQGTVTYEPVYATAIAWFLDVARQCGHPAPGED